MENYARVKLRPSTFKTSQGFLKNHIKPQIGNIPLAELTSLDLVQNKHSLRGFLYASGAMLILYQTKIRRRDSKRD